MALISSFQIWIFLSVSLLILLSRSYSTMLSRSTESRHSIFVSDNRGKVLSLSPASIILADFNRCFLSDWRFLLFLCIDRFFDEWILTFVKCIYCVYWSYHLLFFSFLVVNMVSYINWFHKSKANLAFLG